MEDLTGDDVPSFALLRFCVFRMLKTFVRKEIHRRITAVCIYDNVMVESFVGRRVREFNTGRETVCERKCSDRPSLVTKDLEKRVFVESDRRIDTGYQFSLFSFFFPFLLQDRKSSWMSNTSRETTTRGT